MHGVRRMPVWRRTSGWSGRHPPESSGFQEALHESQIQASFAKIKDGFEAMRRGADHFLTKPVNPDELIVTLSRWGKQIGSRFSY